jgi:hypothetical protein
VVEVIVGYWLGLLAIGASLILRDSGLLSVCSRPWLLIATQGS